MRLAESRRFGIVLSPLLQEPAHLNSPWSIRAKGLPEHPLGLLRIHARAPDADRLPMCQTAPQLKISLRTAIDHAPGPAVPPPAQIAT